MPEGEAVVWIRTIVVQTHLGQVDELVRRWREQVAPHIPGVPGLRGVYLCGNRDANTVMAVQVWDNLPDQATRETHHQHQFREHVRDIISGEPAAEGYEVLAVEERP